MVTSHYPPGESLGVVIAGSVSEAKITHILLLKGDKYLVISENFAP